MALECVSETNGELHGDVTSNCNSRKEAKRRSRKPPPKKYKAIQLGPDEQRTVDAAIEQLAFDNLTYQFNGLLGRVIHDQDFSDRHTTRPPNAPYFVPMEASTLSARLSTVARFTKLQPDGSTRVTRSPDRLLSAILAQQTWPSIRKLRGITSGPVLRRNGSVFNGPGFDEVTGIYTDYCGTIRNVRQVLRAEVQAAIGRLLQIVVDFPFASEADKSAWLAGLLTAVVRHLIDGPAPLTLIDANVAGSGKTLLADLISLIAFGRQFPRTTYRHDDAEMRKAITSVVLAGDAATLLDNISGPFGCPSLDAALTSTVWSDRLLGKNQTVGGEIRVTWYATANNAVVAGDLVRRTVYVRLKSKMERPEERTGFQFPDVIATARELRESLVQDVVTVVQGYLLDGMPNQNLAPFGSFESWSRLVRGAIVWAGLPDPAATRVELRRGADLDAVAASSLVHGLDALCRGTALTTLEIIERMKAEPDEHQELWGAMSAVFGIAAGELPTVRKLGNKLASLRERVFGTKALESMNASDNRQKWRVSDVTGKK